MDNLLLEVAQFIEFVPSGIRKILLTGELDNDYKSHFDYVFYKPYEFKSIVSLLNILLIKKIS
jgi:hypothetical protein